MTDDPCVDCGTIECDLHGGANVCVRGSRARVLASAHVCACAIIDTTQQGLETPSIHAR